MHFITLNTKQLNSPAYTSLKLPHLLITITDAGKQIKVPAILHCKKRLHLNFSDIEGVDENGFDMSMAKDILDFVNDKAHLVDLIVVQSEHGIGRNTAVASALSKIINHKDDSVFSHGLANMFVYSTILDAYFMEKPLKWPRIDYLRKESVKLNVKSDIFKFYCLKQSQKES